MDHTALLARVPLFSGLSQAEIAELDLLTVEANFPEDRNIITIGEPGDALYVLIEGTVAVLYPGQEQEFELARLGPGDFFGEMALLNEEPRSATVRALEPCRALVIEKEDFRRLVSSSGTVSLKLLDILSRRIRYADEQMGGLSEQALRDPLTGLLNRRAFHERLSEEANRVRRYGEIFSLIILDVDHFKVINDSRGHDVGDEVLRWIARVLNELTRAADAVFRIGGEEFAILAPAASAEVARSVGNRIRATIGEARPPVEGDLRVTISAGFATCPDHGRHPDFLFHLADQALLRAKAGGRNRIEDAIVPGGDPSEVL